MQPEHSKVCSSNVLAFFILGVCLVGLLITSCQIGFVKAQATQAGQEGRRDLKPTLANKYFFSEETPRGDWLAQADIDVLQSNDPTVPVAIAGLRTYVGKGNWRKQLMIESVVLNNHTLQAVAGVKLGWIILAEQSFKLKENREAALVEGYTQLSDSQLSGQRMKRVKGINIDFAKAVKPLIKAGILTGTFFLRIRVSEVRFENGSVWTENETSPSNKRFSHSRSSMAQLPNCPNKRCLFHENGQG